LVLFFKKEHLPFAQLKVLADGQLRRAHESGL
jgi:hypothetical protein